VREPLDPGLTWEESWRLEKCIDFGLSPKMQGVTHVTDSSGSALKINFNPLTDRDIIVLQDLFDKET